MIKQTMGNMVLVWVYICLNDEDSMVFYCLNAIRL